MWVSCRCFLVDPKKKSSDLKAECKGWLCKVFVDSEKKCAWMRFGLIQMEVSIIMGVPPVIIHSRTNQPAIGVPPWLGTPPRLLLAPWEVVPVIHYTMGGIAINVEGGPGTSCSWDNQTFHIKWPFTDPSKGCVFEGFCLVVTWLFPLEVGRTVVLILRVFECKCKQLFTWCDSL